MHFDYAQSGFEIRPSIAEAHLEAWRIIGEPGNWWRAEDRVAIAQESRNARSCTLCRDRKAALSPFATIEGAHHQTTNLPPVVVDVVHRLVTDASRLTRTWLDGLDEQGVTDGHYVELLGVVVSLVSVDAFHRALSLPLEPLPQPQAGDPSGYRPAGARDHGAWVPSVAPADLADSEADLYGGAPEMGNVIKAMSLVPDSVRLLTILGEQHYMAPNDVADPTSNAGRAISRPQIELLAGRVSSLSDCFY